VIHRVRWRVTHHVRWRVIHRVCWRVMRVLLVLALAVAPSPGGARAQGASWATTQAEQLTAQGRAHAAQGDMASAAKRYLEALGFDATYGPAYLSLGALHEAAGEWREAERTYTVGMDHIAGFADGLVARARLYARQGRMKQAIADYEAARAARPDDTQILRALGEALIATGALPAALAVERRIAALCEARGEARAASEARAAARALSLLVAGADPVVAGAKERGPVRRAIARLAHPR